MAREKLIAEEIQRIVQQHVDQIREVREDDAKIRVPLPYQHEAGPDACNWNMDVFGNATGYSASIAKVVAWAKSQFRLV